MKIGSKVSFCKCIHKAEFYILLMDSFGSSTINLANARKYTTK